MKPIKLKFFLPFLIIAAGILIFFLLKVTRPSSQPVAVRERVWLVKTQIAKPRSLAPTLQLYGQVETPTLVKASAPITSRVLAVLAREGDAIVAEQLLLTLDPRDFQPRVAQAEAKVAELQALIDSEVLRHEADQQVFSHEQSLLELELAAFKRARMMTKKNLGSRAAMEQAQEQLEKQRLELISRKLALQDHQPRIEQLQARLAYAEAELQLARLNLERSQIIAPFAGYVEKLQVAPGDQVKENQLLISFYPLDDMEVRAKIPDVYRQELQQAIVTGKILTAKAVTAGMPITLVFDRVAGSADARGIDALFKITQGSQSLRLGSTFSLSLQRPAIANAVALPFSALYDNDWIYQVVDGRLAGIQVKRLGEFTDSHGQLKILVSSPKLQGGEEIVLTHLPNAIDGLRVTSR